MDVSFILLMYVFVSLIISVSAMIDLLHPVISQYEMTLDIKFLHYMVFGIIGFITAPLLLPALVSSLIGLEFRMHLNKALFE